MKNTFRIFAAAICLFGAVSCEDFLDRPSEDSYTVGDFYKNDDQVKMAVNYLYSSPWNDVTRFYIYDSEALAGNVYLDGSPYLSLTANGSDTDLKNMSYSLWAINSHCNTVIQNIVNSEGPSQGAKDRYIGECLAWKAMAYFMLVRTFGDIPIIHDNSAIIAEATYNEVSKVQKSDVYEYIIMTIEAAMEKLPKNAYIGEYNRLDYYAAEALLSKVYLTKAGLSGSLDKNDLDAALKYAKDVIENSGRSLTPKYSDIFRISPADFQQTGEALFSWLWNASSGIWTCQSFIQSDVGLVGFSETGDLWGDWKGPSIDLQEAFGVSATDNPESRRNEKDTRRKATCMMFGDQYDYFWTDKGGFDFYRFFYDETYGVGSNDAPNISSKTWGCGSGSNYAKHLYGNMADHEAAIGITPSNMTNQLPTHILRLADIYLVAAEAAVLTGDGDAAKKYINAVRQRAGVDPLTSVTFDDVWKERRLELALEGDRWYDFVRRSYYDVNACIAEIKSQKRSAWEDGDFNAMHKTFVMDAATGKIYQGPGAGEWDSSAFKYKGSKDLTDVKTSMFTLPMPTEDVELNPKMASSAPSIHVDVRAEYSYDF